MSTWRDKELQKEWIKKNHERLKIYKRDWNRKARGSKLAIIIPPPPQAKTKCILCSKELEMTKERYEKYGNFCRKCS